jgi:signal transduction histidine kinase
MKTATAQLNAVFELQSYNFASGLIAGGFVFFTLLALTVVWFLKNKLLKLLLVFTSLQTLLVSFDFQHEAFGIIGIEKLILSALFTVIAQEYNLEVKTRTQLVVTKFERSYQMVLGICVLMIVCFKLGLLIVLKITFTLLLSYWLYLGLKISQVLQKVRFSYRTSGFLLWFYSWFIFLILLLPSSLSNYLNCSPYPQLIYIGWLLISFFAALILIHQVVQLNTENYQLEKEQLFLKGQLGLAQLESSENERKRIVAELHNDVLNRIDMLSMTVNQNGQNQELVNKNLTDSLHVLRQYTYKLYPPHTDVLPLADIFLREAELWRNQAVNIEVRFNPIWNNLSDHYIMPVFRFIERVTDLISKQVSVHQGIWHFTEADQRLILKLEYFGDVEKFSLKQENYLIYLDLLDAYSIENSTEGGYQIVLTLSNYP